MNKMKKSTWCVIYVFFVIDVLVTDTWKIRRHLFFKKYNFMNPIFHSFQLI